MIKTTIKKKQSPIKEIPTFKQIIELNKNINKILIIITSDFKHELPKKSLYLKNSLIKNITDFQRSDEFELFVTNFFKNCKKELLMLEYEEININLNHFIHVKHILESIKYHYCHKNNNNIKNKKRIMLILYLRRNNNKFQLLFSNSCKYIYIDSLSEIIPINLNLYCKQTIIDYY